MDIEPGDLDESLLIEAIHYENNDMKMPPKYKLPAAEIKLLEAEVLENENLEVISESSIIYVGNIDEDDYESAEFEIRVSGNDVIMPVVVRYKDALNRDYSEHFDLVVHVQDTNGKKFLGSVWMWLLIVVIVSIGIWWWHKHKVKKKR